MQIIYLAFSSLSRLHHKHLLRTYHHLPLRPLDRPAPDFLGQHNRAILPVNNWCHTRGHTVRKGRVADRKLGLWLHPFDPILGSHLRRGVLGSWFVHWTRVRVAGIGARRKTDQRVINARLSNRGDVLPSWRVHHFGRARFDVNAFVLRWLAVEVVPRLQAVWDLRLRLVHFYLHLDSSVGWLAGHNSLHLLTHVFSNNFRLLLRNLQLQHHL